MSHPLLLSRLPFTTSTSSSSFTLPSTTTPENTLQSGQYGHLQEHPMHHEHLHALPVDKQRHQESLWRENLQSGGNPRTTTPTQQGGSFKHHVCILEIAEVRSTRRRQINFSTLVLPVRDGEPSLHCALPHLATTNLLSLTHILHFFFFFFLPCPTQKRLTLQTRQLWLVGRCLDRP